MKLLGLFPGQGSQQVGMGRAFFEADEHGADGQARSVFAEADGALNFSLSSLCFDGPLERLTLTEFAQPAILATSYVCYLAWKRSGGRNIDVAAGHSLGEYTALVAAGALTLADAVVLVHKRGRYMQEAVEPGQGKMVAVIGPTAGEISTALAQVVSGVAEIANLNSPGQIVVAGDVRGVDSFSKIMAEQGGKIIPLNVSAPFHCSLMKPAQDRLAKDLDSMTFSPLQFPVYSNVMAQAIQSGDEARELLKKQVCASVRWEELVRNVIAGTQTKQAIEFGPGGVLAKLLKRIDSSVQRFEVFDPNSLEKARNELTNCQTSA